MVRLFSVLFASSLCFSLNQISENNTAHALEKNTVISLAESNEPVVIDNALFLETETENPKNFDAIVNPEKLLASKNYFVSHKLATQSYLNALDNLLKDIGYTTGMEQVKVVNKEIYDTFVNEYINIVSNMSTDEALTYKTALDI